MPGRLFILLFIFAALVFGRSVFATPSERVENGDAVPASDPLTRSVAQVRFGNGVICSASFLTPRVLLTAGHCTKGKSYSNTRIQIRDAKGTLHTAKVKKLVTHPKYKISETANGTQFNFDIGVIFLNQEFPFAVRPLKISSVGGMETNNEIVSIAGYGRNSQYGGLGVLRTGYMDSIVIKHELFNGRRGIFMTPEENQIVCGGDSGGAVLRGDTDSQRLIGVHSLSNGCKGGIFRYALSEIAADHKAWIKSVAPEVP